MESLSFERYETRQSFWILGVKIFLFEIFVLFLHLFLLFISNVFNFKDILFLGLSLDFWELIFIHFFNTFVLFYKFLDWYNFYYTIGSKSISSFSGIISKKIHSQDIRMISKIDLDQGFFGRIFDYGDILIESPLVKTPMLVKNISHPGKWKTQIEEFHENAVKKSPVSSEEFVSLTKK